MTDTMLRRTDYNDIPLNDSHAWLEDESGNVIDPTPISITKREMYYYKKITGKDLKIGYDNNKKPFRIYKAFPESTQLRLSIQVAKLLPYIQATNVWKTLIEKPIPNQCHLNVSAYKKQHPELKVVIGSQGWPQPDGSIFWQFG